jgi:serine/threonine protein kinase
MSELEKKVMQTEIDQLLYDKSFNKFMEYPNAILIRHAINILNNAVEKGYILIYSGGGGVIFKILNEPRILKIIYDFNECEIYARLPRIEGMPYADPDLTHCRITSKREIFEMFDDKLIKYDVLNEKTDEEEVESPYYIISMPFLGIDLFTYLFHFSYLHYNKIWVAVPELPGDRDMTVSIFKNLCDILHTFNIKLNEMHKYMVHKDLKPNNIIFDIERNELILIDFDQSRVYPDGSPPEKEIFKDNFAFIHLVIKQVLYYAIRNKYIYESIKKTRLLMSIETYKSGADCVKLTSALKKFADRLEEGRDEYMPDSSFIVHKLIDDNSKIEETIRNNIRMIQLLNNNTRESAIKYLDDKKTSALIKRSVLDRLGLGQKSKRKKSRKKKSKKRKV